MARAVGPVPTKPLGRLVCPSIISIPLERAPVGGTRIVNQQQAEPGRAGQSTATTPGLGVPGAEQTRGRMHPEWDRHRVESILSRASSGSCAPGVEQTRGRMHPEWSRLRAGCTGVGADSGRCVHRA